MPVAAGPLGKCLPCVAEEQTRVVLFGRSTSPETLDMATLSLRRGTSGTTGLTVTTLDAIPSWKHDAFQNRTMSNVALDVSWAENEEKPSAYVSALR